jgi:hypothetical protein
MKGAFMLRGRVTFTILVLSAALGGTIAGLGTSPPAFAAPIIQPGSSLEFDGSFCTANWVYTGPGGTYIGAAGHCTTGVGQQVNLATGSLGTTIERIGQVAYVSGSLDFLLVQLDGAVLGQVDASMAGHPGTPTGVSTTSTAQQGDLVQFSGHGVGFDVAAPTQQQRVGVLNFFDGGYQFVLGLVTPGDSGGPVADITDGNKALGIVDTVGVNIAFPNANVGEGGVAVYALIQDATEHGFPITLRTA